MTDTLRNALAFAEGCAEEVGRTSVGGFRIVLRTGTERLEADLISFASAVPKEERVLISRDAKGYYLLAYGLQDFVQALEEGVARAR